MAKVPDFMRASPPDDDIIAEDSDEALENNPADGESDAPEEASLDEADDKPEPTFVPKGYRVVPLDPATASIPNSYYTGTAAPELDPDERIGVTRPVYWHNRSKGQVLVWSFLNQEWVLCSDVRAFIPLLGCPTVMAFELLDSQGLPPCDGVPTKEIIELPSVRKWMEEVL